MASEENEHDFTMNFFGFFKTKLLPVHLGICIYVASLYLKVL